ncbi:hypothetical protein [Fluviicola taffensis]|uniref:hypothetical protein n=1 Tax=Fluviicola taffensis TaxID=191579 RepID=UPI0031376FBC
MSVTNEQKQQQKEAILENMLAIKYCLDFNKNEDDLLNIDEGGCLGYPAFILICSVIDTIGSFFSGGDLEIQIDGDKRKIEKAAEHFFILNQLNLFNFNLSGTTIFDFYSCFRSTLTHNNSLPENRFLKKGESGSKIFEIDNNQKIHSISLIPLNETLCTAVTRFIHWLEYGTWSPDHKLKKDLEEKSKNHNSKSIDLLRDSGFTETIIVKIIS